MKAARLERPAKYPTMPAIMLNNQRGGSISSMGLEGGSKSVSWLTPNTIPAVTKEATIARILSFALSAVVTR